MPEEQNWLRRQAIQIAAQLPENADDALQVLDLAKSLVSGFLKEPQVPLDRLRGEVVAFPASSSSSSR